MPLLFSFSFASRNPVATARGSDRCFCHCYVLFRHQTQSLPLPVLTMHDTNFVVANIIHPIRKIIQAFRWVFHVIRIEFFVTQPGVLSQKFLSMPFRSICYSHGWCFRRFFRVSRQPLRRHARLNGRGYVPFGKSRGRMNPRNSPVATAHGSVGLRFNE